MKVSDEAAAIDHRRCCKINLLRFIGLIQLCNSARLFVSRTTNDEYDNVLFNQPFRGEMMPETTGCRTGDVPAGAPLPTERDLRKDSLRLTLSCMMLSMY